VNLKSQRHGGKKKKKKEIKIKIKLEFKTISYLCHDEVCTVEAGIRRQVKSSTVEHLNSLMLEAREKSKPASWIPAHPAEPAYGRVGHPGPPWAFLCRR